MNRSIELINSKKDERVNFIGQLYTAEEIIREKEIKPDNSIGKCKIILESISKQILVIIDKTLTEKDISGMDFPPLFRQLLNKLSDFDPTFEVEFTLRSGSIVQRISEIRNLKDEEAHGKIYPRSDESNPLLAELIIQITDAIICYILTSFYSLDLNPHLGIAYEGNEEFNDYLDELHTGLGIRYSKAIYDQDYIQYAQLLLDFNDKEFIT